jgi:hypothetical protein
MPSAWAFHVRWPAVCCLLGAGTSFIWCCTRSASGVTTWLLNGRRCQYTSTHGRCIQAQLAHAGGLYPLAPAERPRTAVATTAMSAPQNQPLRRNEKRPSSSGTSADAAKREKQRKGASTGRGALAPAGGRGSTAAQWCAKCSLRRRRRSLLSPTRALRGEGLWLWISEVLTRP